MTILGSRAQFCVHPRISKLRGKIQDSACQTHCKNGKCHFHGKVMEVAHSSTLREELNHVFDIEDLVEFGKKKEVCPYFLSREILTQSLLVFLPYNYIVDQTAYKRMGIDLQQSIIVFDEGHNIEKALCDASSFEFTSTDIAACIREVGIVLGLYKPIVEPLLLKDRSAVKKADKSLGKGNMSKFEYKMITEKDLAVLRQIFLNIERALDEVKVPKEDTQQNGMNQFSGINNYNQYQNNNSNRIAGGVALQPQQLFDILKCALLTPESYSVFSKFMQDYIHALGVVASMGQVEFAMNQQQGVNGQQGYEQDSILSAQGTASIDDEAYYDQEGVVQETGGDYEKLKRIIQRGAVHAFSTAMDVLFARNVSDGFKVYIWDEVVRKQRQQLFSSGDSYSYTNANGGKGSNNSGSNSGIVGLFSSPKQGQSTREGSFAQSSSQQQSLDFITVRHVGFWCFDASIAMNEIIGLKPQSIVITSGTLSPLSGFAYELGLSLPLVHQNRHVVDASQVWVSVISRGAQGGTMNFSYAHRKKMKDLQYGQKGKQFNQSSYYGSSYSGDGLSQNLNLLDELGITIVDIASCVANGGILVFFPSYELMEECMREWSTPRPRNEQQQQQQSSSYNHNNSNIQQSWNTPNKPISNQKAIVQILREQGKLLMCEPRLASQLGRVIEQYRNATGDQNSDLDSNSESGITDLGFGVGNSGSKSGKMNQNPKMSISEFGNEISGFGQVSNNSSGKGFKIGGDIGITNNQTISNHQSSYHQSTPYTKQNTSPSSNSSNQHKQSFQSSSSSSSSYQQPQFTGAVLLGVCRGKLSEGIDFSDSAARVVIMVGVPFQNTHDPKVKLKMQYMNERKDKINRVKTKQSNSLNTNTNNSLQLQIIQQNLPQANSQKQPTKPTQSSAEYILDGSLWYHMQAIRAVNQSIGRVIRHKKDYGAIVLIDERYLEQDNLVKLSSWVQESLHGGWWLIECERIKLKEKQREKEKKQEIEYQKEKEKEMKRIEMKMELDSDVITEFEEFETKQERDNILSVLNFDQQTPLQVSPIHQYKQNKPSSQQKSLQSTQSSSQQTTSFQLPFQINQLLPSSSFTYFELITSLRRFFNETPKLLNMMQTTLPFSFQPIPQISNDDQNSLWKPFSDYQFAPPFIIGPDDEKEMKLVMELVEKKKIKDLLQKEKGFLFDTKEVTPTVPSQVPVADFGKQNINESSKNLLINRPQSKAQSIHTSSAPTTIALNRASNGQNEQEAAAARKLMKDKLFSKLHNAALAKSQNANSVQNVKSTEEQLIADFPSKQVPSTSVSFVKQPNLPILMKSSSDLALKDELYSFEEVGPNPNQNEEQFTNEYLLTKPKKRKREEQNYDEINNDQENNLLSDDFID